MKYQKQDSKLRKDLIRDLNSVSDNAGVAGAIGTSALLSGAFSVAFASSLGIFGIPALALYSIFEGLDMTGLPGAAVSKIFGNRRKLNRLMKGEENRPDGKVHYDCKADYLSFLNIARDKTTRLQQALYKKVDEKIDAKRGQAALDEDSQQKELTDLYKLRDEIAETNYFNVKEKVGNVNGPAYSPMAKLIVRTYKSNNDSNGFDVLNKICRTKMGENPDIAFLDDLTVGEVNKDLREKILNGTVKISDLTLDQKNSLECHLKNKEAKKISDQINSNFLGVVPANGEEDEIKKTLQIEEIISSFAFDKSQRFAFGKKPKKGQTADNTKNIKLNKQQNAICSRFNLNPENIGKFKNIAIKNLMIDLNGKDTDKTSTARDTLIAIISNDKTSDFYIKNKDYFKTMKNDEIDPGFKFGSEIDIAKYLNGSKADKKKILSENDYFDENGKKVKSIFGKVHAMNQYIKKTSRNCTELGQSLKPSNNRCKLTAFPFLAAFDAGKALLRQIPAFSKIKSIQSKRENSSVVVGEMVAPEQAIQSDRFLNIVKGKRFSLNPSLRVGLMPKCQDLFANYNMNNQKEKTLLNLGRMVLPENKFKGSKDVLISNNIEIYNKAKIEDFQVSYLKQPIEIIVYGQEKRTEKAIAAFSFNSKDLLNGSIEAIIEDLNGDSDSLKITVACGGFETNFNKVAGEFSSDLIKNAVKNYVTEEYETRIINAPEFLKAKQAKEKLANEKAKYMDLHNKLINTTNSAINTVDVEKVTNDTSSDETFAYLTDSQFIPISVKEIYTSKAVFPVCGNIPAISETSKDLIMSSPELYIQHGNNPLSICVAKDDTFTKAINAVKDAENDILTKNTQIDIFEEPLEVITYDNKNAAIGVFCFSNKQSFDAFFDNINDKSTIASIARVEVKNPKELTGIVNITDQTTLENAKIYLPNTMKGYATLTALQKANGLTVTEPEVGQIVTGVGPSNGFTADQNSRRNTFNLNAPNLNNMSTNSDNALAREYNKLSEETKRLRDENASLKQQLAEKDKTIDELTEKFVQVTAELKEQKEQQKITNEQFAKEMAELRKAFQDLQNGNGGPDNGGNGQNGNGGFNNGNGGPNNGGNGQKGNGGFNNGNGGPDNGGNGQNNGNGGSNNNNGGSNNGNGGRNKPFEVPEVKTRGELEIAIKAAGKRVNKKLTTIDGVIDEIDSKIKKWEGYLAYANRVTELIKNGNGVSKEKEEKEEKKKEVSKAYETLKKAVEKKIDILKEKEKAFKPIKEAISKAGEDLINGTKNYTGEEFSKKETDEIHNLLTTLSNTLKGYRVSGVDDVTNRTIEGKNKKFKEVAGVKPVLVDKGEGKSSDELTDKTIEGKNKRFKEVAGREWELDDDKELEELKRKINTY